jgi:hypothetical protein
MNYAAVGALGSAIVLAAVSGVSRANSSPVATSVTAEGSGDPVERSMPVRRSKRETFEFALISGDRRPPDGLAASLEVFSQPSSPDDRLSVDVLHAEGVLDHETTANAPQVPEDWRPGRLKPGNSRLLLTIPTRDVHLFAMPTEQGAVCTVALGIGSEIVSSLREGFTMSVSRSAQGGPLYVYGLLDDNIEAARVGVKEIDVEAVVGRNGYFVAIEDPTVGVDNVTSFELTYRDGSSRRVTLDLA